MNESEPAGDPEPAGPEERPPAAAEDAEAMEAAAAASASAPAAARGRSGPEAAAAAAQELPYELQQGYRILGEFLQEKHRGLTAPFLQPFGSGAAAAAAPGDQEPEPEELEEKEAAAAPRGAPRALLPRRARPDVGLLQMEAKFARGQYASITDFVADFRAMLEACYRRHGVDHWVSKQGQKLEMMLEQKLALLSR